MPTDFAEEPKEKMISKADVVLGRILSLPRSRARSVFAALGALVFHPGSVLADTSDRASALTAQYCVACHNHGTRMAKVSLEGLDPTDIAHDPGLWEKVLRRVASGEMPPAGVLAPDPPGRISPGT